MGKQASTKAFSVEYFFSKNEKLKAKEVFNQILILPKVNNDIKLESRKRLNRDLSE